MSQVTIDLSFVAVVGRWSRSRPRRKQVLVLIWDNARLSRQSSSLIPGRAPSSNLLGECPRVSGDQRVCDYCGCEQTELLAQKIS